MQNIFASVLAVAGISVAAASSSVDLKQVVETQVPGIVFDCEFHSRGKERVHCDARVVLCVAIENVVDRLECEQKVRIECSNGTELFDRDPEFNEKDGSLFVKAKDDGHEAKIEIEDIAGNNVQPEEVVFDAKLKLENGKPLRLRGECELVRPDPDPTVTATATAVPQLEE